jgi:DNA repair protein RecN (Recombination protein N)
VFTQMRIRGVGVIDDAVLELSPGLNVVTGETGAGKTMVVSGLGLLLGERADSGLVRTGRESASVEGVLELASTHPALARADEAGAEHDDGELVVARTLTAAGRSRAHVGGRTAPVGVLADLGRLLVAVHGQADQWRLKQGDAHREVLDDYAGSDVLTLRERVRTSYDGWRTLKAEHEALVAQARERARDIDALTASLEEIEAVDPQPAEDVALRAEDERLAHADTLRLAAAGALELLSGDDLAGESRADVRELLAGARAALAPGTEHDEQLRQLDERLHEVGTLVTELAADLSAYVTDVELDPGRLEFVQQRRATLAGLTRKYGDTVDEVLEWSGRAAARLDGLVTADGSVDALGDRVGTAEAELGEAVAALSQARSEAARHFGDDVCAELAHLSMGRAQVVVEVRPRLDPDGVACPDGSRVRVSPTGADDVEILMAANPGASPRSIARSASGGELSRVMLALEVVGAARGGADGPPTFVFDEVDAGVGGRAAVDVGARLARLARQSQVIVVTHLAQVAAFADRHLVVHKSDDGAVTSSDVTVVDGDERLRELSRMMGGDPDSDAGLAHARDLLAQAAQTATEAGALSTKATKATKSAKSARATATRAAGRATGTKRAGGRAVRVAGA